jgi:biopolymer transport protein ExbB/TolQ
MVCVPKTAFAVIWLERGWIPYAICGVFFWGAAMLLIKWRKLALQRSALGVGIVPDASGFVLSPQSSDQVLENLYRQVQDPERFVLFARVLRAISNMKNMGRISDVETILRSQSENDQNVMETSYTVLKGFIWTMPVLGFIGTVQGLSMAIGKFGSVLASGGEMHALRESLRQVVHGLSVAFDTTFQGLVCTLILQMVLTFFRKQEEEFLDSCDTYCHRHIVSRLRFLVGEEGRDGP